MTDIALGANDLDDLKQGTVQVDAVYQGTNLMWRPSVQLIDSITHTSAGGAWSFSIAGMTFEAGDIGVLLWGASTNSSVGAILTPTMTSLYEDTEVDLYSSVQVLTMTGSETDIAYDGTSLNETAIIFAIFRKADEPTSVNTFVAGSGLPDPPSVGSVALRDLVLAMGVLDDDINVMTVQPGYTLIEALVEGTFPTVGVAMSFQTGLTGNVDPDPFGGGGDDANHGHTIRLIRS